MNRRAFTIVELLVVIGVIAILVALLFPAIKAQMESARTEEMRAQLEIFRAAIEMYQGQFADFPTSAGPGDNAGIEVMLACLRSTEGGGPFILERKIRNWLDDTDGDGRQELVDPWGNPWIYFHHLEYAVPDVYYIIKGNRVLIQAVKAKDSYRNHTSYQLRACGPNETSEHGRGDDAANY